MRPVSASIVFEVARNPPSPCGIEIRDGFHALAGHPARGPSGSGTDDLSPGGAPALNEYFGSGSYHPLVVWAEVGQFVFGRLRPGNAPTAGAVEDLEGVISRVEEALGRVEAVRGEAGFPTQELLGRLEERGVGYAFRLRGNAVLARMAAPYLRRPAGGRPKVPPGSGRTWWPTSSTVRPRSTWVASSRPFAP